MSLTVRNPALNDLIDQCLDIIRNQYDQNEITFQQQHRMSAHLSKVKQLQYRGSPWDANFDTSGESDE
jgi:hypothetical protein